MGEPNRQQQIELEAAAFRRLVGHLRERSDVQNIDLMNLASFLSQLPVQLVPRGCGSRRSRRVEGDVAGDGLRHAL